MKPPGEGVQGALSTDLLTRQRITPKLRLHMTAAFDRVACTYKGVCIADDGHGTWKVLGLQPRANTNLYTAASSSSSAYSEGQGAYSTLLAPPPRGAVPGCQHRSKVSAARVARLELGPCSPHDKAVVRYDLPYCGTRLWYPPRLTTARPSGIPRSKTRGLTALAPKLPKYGPAIF